MKVLLFTNLYPWSRDPVRGVFNQQRFLALSRHCEARVVAPLSWWSRTRHPAAWFTVPRECGTGLEAVFPTYWSMPRLSRLHAAGLYASMRGYVRRLRRKFPFDVILAAYAHPDGVAAARLARELDCPLVTMVLGSDLNRHTREPAVRRQVEWALRRSHRVVAVSAALRDRALELGLPPEQVLVQHNGVDGSRFAIRPPAEARARLGLRPEDPLLCYAGNLHNDKGVDVLVQAMAQLRRAALSPAQLAIVGGGPEAAPLRAQVEQLGLDDCIRFYGRRPHAEIADWISAADILCLPSRREGCPNVVLEALASGRPVVATRVGGVPELLNGENGLVVRPEDPGAFAAALAEALARPWIPERLRATVPYLSWDRFGQALRDVLQDAVICGSRAARTAGAPTGVSAAPSA